MSISRALRFQILRRDNNTCRYCGRSAPEVKLTIDHVTPQALGGSDDPANLVTACEDCNGGKSAIPPDAAQVAQVADDAVRWAAAVRSAAAAALADLNRRKADREAFLSAWQEWTVRSTGERLPLPPDWEETVDRFVALGLPLEILIDGVQVAMNRKNIKPANTFNYLCGIAWNKVREIQEAAGVELGGDVDDEEWEPHTRCRSSSRNELIIEVFGDLFHARGAMFDRAHGWARQEVAADPDDRVYPEEPSEVVITARTFLEELDATLTARDLAIRHFLAQMPADVLEQATEAAKHDFHCANQPITNEAELAPHILRHVGNAFKDA